MGSVKDPVIGEGLGADLYVPAKPHDFGAGGWLVSGRFSVGDLKDKIPGREIAEKAYVLTMMTAGYFENAENKGMESCYLGMIDKDGNVVDTQTLLDRGEKSNLIYMRLANAPASSNPDDVRAYHQAIQNGDISVYVADAESIFRAGLPLGSSSFKKIFQMAGRGDIYEKLATYDETTGELEAIREGFKRSRRDEFLELKAYLNQLGLKDVPNPGQVLSEPVLNFTTKFAISGDEDITESQARERMGLTDEAYEDWKGLVRKCADDQIAYSQERGIVNIDGKLEGVVAEGRTILTDFANTPDENRLMITHEQDGITYLVPTNKEIQRAIFRARGIYDAIDQSKEHAEKTDGTKDTWRDHLFEFTTQRTLEDATEESCEMMSDALREVGNRALRTDIFDAKPIDQWVESFLPYASRVQEEVAA